MGTFALRLERYQISDSKPITAHDNRGFPVLRLPEKNPLRFRSGFQVLHSKSLAGQASY